MAGRRKTVLDIREMVRMMRMGAGERRISRAMEISRNTVAKYREWARKEGYLEAEELPPIGVMEQQLKHLEKIRERLPGPGSLVEPHRAFVEQKRGEGVEIQALLGLLREQGFAGSYSSLRRFVMHLEERTPDVFLRIETGPGEEAQVDFGYAGKLYDCESDRIRDAWVFVMTLSFSRHQYARIVFTQRVETWIDLHVRAFEAFGGSPKRVVLDNLKAGIVKAVLHDSEGQRSYRELAEQYGFLISPCRPGTPRHKGKVESGVRYVRRNALAGRDFRDADTANKHLEKWVMEVAGLRDHGTTHEEPLSRFEIEREALGPLPRDRYEVIVWKQGKVHSDCHVVFDYSYYSVPHRLVGETLWIRATPYSVELYHEHERLVTHPRATRRGCRSTQPDHLPPEKIMGLLPEPASIRASACEVGPACTELIERLLGEHPMDRLRGAQGILRLGKQFGARRLETACRRAIIFNEIRYQTVKAILRTELDLMPLPESGVGPLPKTAVFARSAAELMPSTVQ